MNTMKENDLTVASFNCQGFKYRNYQFITKLFDMCSILLIQGHWLYEFEFNILNEILTNCS